MKNKTQEYIVDDTLVFIFPDDWKIAKCDDWVFYRKQFCRVRNDPKYGMTCVDLLALDPKKTLWLIEVKDYRQHRRTKEIPLWNEIRNKVVDTLSMLLPAACNALDEELIFAKGLLKTKKIKVICHYEQPKRHSKLFPIDNDLAEMQAKIKQLLKSIDPHPMVMDSHSRPRSIPWEIRDA